MRTLAQKLVKSDVISRFHYASTKARVLDTGGQRYPYLIHNVTTLSYFNLFAAYTDSEAFLVSDTQKNTLLNVVGSGSLNFVWLPRPLSTADLNYELEVLIDGKQILLNENAKTTAAPIISFNCPISGDMSILHRAATYRAAGQGLTFKNSLVINLRSFPVSNAGDALHVHPHGMINYHLDALTSDTTVTEI